MSIQVGDRLPTGALHEKNPKDVVDPADAFANGKFVIFGVPGAFTGTCNTQLPGFAHAKEQFSAKGIDEVVCVAVNDAFVMQAWGEANTVDGKVRMLADPSAAWVSSMGLEVDASGALGNVRSKRFAMVVENGAVTVLHVEPDAFPLTITAAPDVLEKL